MLNILSYINRKIRNNPFPSVVIVIFILLTILGVSGSSMGTFDEIFLGKSPGVILGIPRPVRSDEWLVVSQETLIQKAANYPAVNKNIGRGEDMSTVIDVPFRSLFTAFKPDNLFFFVMPYANAFAAKWWFMSLVLVLGFYFLMDSLFPRKRIIISLAASVLLLNPFVQWWYQSITLLTIGYALWACFMLIKIFERKADFKNLILYCTGLAYFTLCFIYLLYPPFQLSVAYVIISLLVGYFYFRYFSQRVKFREDLKRWLAIVIAAFAVIMISGIFFITHEQVVHTVMNTAYPGTRSIQSGQNGSLLDGGSLNMIDTFSSPILFNLQKESKNGLFYTNQSEASRIVVINLLLLPIFVVSTLKKPRKNRGLADYLLLSTSTIAGIFMIRMFTPFFNLPFKLLLFNKIQNERLAIGLVLLCAIQLVLFGVINIKKISLRKAFIIAAVIFSLFLDASMIMAHHYPKFISNDAVFIACFTIGLASFLLTQKKYFTLGLSLFLIFSIASSVFINPLYHKSEPIALQNAASQIKSRYNNNKNWIVLDSVVIENIPLVAGEHSLSGVQIYPQLALWQSINSAPNYNHTYNRYAHVTFSLNINPDNEEFYSPQDDVLIVHFDCNIANKLPNFGYVLSASPITDELALKCLKLDDTIKYPKATLDIYKYIHP